MCGDRRALNRSRVLRVRVWAPRGASPVDGADQNNGGFWCKNRLERLSRRPLPPNKESALTALAWAGVCHTFAHACLKKDAAAPHPAAQCRIEKGLHSGVSRNEATLGDRTDSYT